MLDNLQQILNYQTKVVVKNGVATLCDSFLSTPFFKQFNPPYIVNITKDSTLKTEQIFFPYDHDFKPVAFNNFSTNVQDFLIQKQNSLIKKIFN